MWPKMEVLKAENQRLEGFTFSKIDRIATKPKRRLQDRTRTLRHGPANRPVLRQTRAKRNSPSSETKDWGLTKSSAWR
jgi:hypothetical protein